MKVNVIDTWKPFRLFADLHYNSTLMYCLCVETQFDDPKTLVFSVAFYQPYLGTWVVKDETVEIRHANILVKVANWNIVVACNRMRDIATMFERLLDKTKLTYDAQQYLAEQLMTIADKGFSVRLTLGNSFKDEVIDVFDMNSQATPFEDA